MAYYKYSLQILYFTGSTTRVLPSETNDRQYDRSTTNFSSIIDLEVAQISLLLCLWLVENEKMYHLMVSDCHCTTHTPFNFLSRDWASSPLLIWQNTAQALLHAGLLWGRAIHAEAWLSHGKYVLFMKLNVMRLHSTNFTCSSLRSSAGSIYKRTLMH